MNSHEHIICVYVYIHLFIHLFIYAWTSMKIAWSGDSSCHFVSKALITLNSLLHPQTTRCTERTPCTLRSAGSATSSGETNCHWKLHMNPRSFKFQVGFQTCFRQSNISEHTIHRDPIVTHCPSLPKGDREMRPSRLQSLRGLPSPKVCLHQGPASPILSQTK